MGPFCTLCIQLWQKVTGNMYNSYCFVLICRKEEHVIYTTQCNCCACFQCPGRELMVLIFRYLGFR